MLRQTFGFILDAIVFTAFLLIPIVSVAQGLPTIEEKTAGMQAIDGHFPMYWDESTGVLWLEISRNSICQASPPGWGRMTSALTAGRRGLG